VTVPTPQRSLCPIRPALLALLVGAALVPRQAQAGCGDYAHAPGAARRAEQPTPSSPVCRGAACVPRQEQAPATPPTTPSVERLWGAWLGDALVLDLAAGRLPLPRASARAIHRTRPPDPPPRRLIAG
jgi:hypothetical protein